MRQTEGEDFVSDLPREIADFVFTYLDASTLSRAARCSKAWRTTSNVNKLWRRQCSIKGWLRYCKAPDLLTESPSHPPASSVSAKSPVYTSPASTHTATLVPPCRWMQIYLRAFHLAENWSRGRYTVAPVLRGHKKHVNTIDSNGVVLVTAGEDNYVKIWELISLKCLYSVLLSGVFGVNTAIIKDSTVLCGCGDGSIHVINLESGDVLYVMTGHQGPVEHLHIHEDSVISAGDRIITIWELTSGEISHSLKAHDEEIECLCYKNGRALTGSWDTSLILWNVARGRMVQRFRGHSEVVTCCSIRGRHIVSGSADHTLRLWDEDSAEATIIMTGHTSEVYCLKTTDDVIASGGADSLVLLWDYSGVILHKLEGHLGIVRCLFIDEEKLISGGDRKKIIIWNYKSGSELCTLHRQPSLLHTFYISPTKLISASPETPGVVTVMKFW